MANPTKVTLIGMKSRTEKARIGIEVVGFMSAKTTFVVTHDTNKDVDSITLKTIKGSYTLNKSLVNNRYEGTCNGINVHIVLNKIIGKIIYWS
jgi:hypothetical protein